MKSKEEELIAIRYQIEKSDIKQQKLESKLSSLSKSLKKSERSRKVLLFLFLLFLIPVGMGLYFLKDHRWMNNDPGHIDALSIYEQKNDSLKNQLIALKAEMDFYREQTIPTDSIAREAIFIDEQNESEEVSEEGEEDKEKKYQRRHCYIKKAFRQDGVIFVEVDFIEYFEGRKAVQKAKEFNKVEYDIDKEGDTVYFLYDDYYIHNPRKMMDRLELSQNAKLANLNQISSGFPLKALQQLIKDNPVMLLESYNGVVFRIREQKIP